MPTRILIVDDHSSARGMIRKAVQFCRCAQPEIIGEAPDGATAIDLARQLAPDIITMDIGLPDMNGLEVTRRLAEELPRINVVMVTMHGERTYRKAAAKVGAASYVDKMNLLAELPDCVDRLAAETSDQSTEDEL